MLDTNTPLAPTALLIYASAAPHSPTLRTRRTFFQVSSSQALQSSPLNSQGDDVVA
jgi:hypothetical protein